MDQQDYNVVVGGPTKCSGRHRQFACSEIFIVASVPKYQSPWYFNLIFKVFKVWSDLSSHFAPSVPYCSSNSFHLLVFTWNVILWPLLYKFYSFLKALFLWMYVLTTLAWCELSPCWTLEVIICPRIWQLIIVSLRSFWKQIPHQAIRKFIISCSRKPELGEAPRLIQGLRCIIEMQIFSAVPSHVWFLLRGHKRAVKCN